MSKKFELWKFIGKLAVVIAIIGGLIKIVTWINTDESYDLKAQGLHFTYAPPVLSHDITAKLIDEKLKDPVFEKPESMDSIDDKFWNSFVKYFLGLGVDYSYVLELDVEGVWVVTITNTGTHSLADINIETPFVGHYSVTQNNKQESNGFTETGVINIGKLRPSGQATLNLWITSDYTGSISQEEATKVTHEDGWSEIEYQKKVSGFLGWISVKQNLLNLVGFTIVVVFFGFIVYMFLDTFRDRRKLIKKQKEQLE